jgi:hypothetical protein
MDKKNSQVHSKKHVKIQTFFKPSPDIFKTIFLPYRKPYENWKILEKFSYGRYCKCLVSSSAVYSITFGWKHEIKDFVCFKWELFNSWLFILYGNSKQIYE